MNKIRLRYSKTGKAKYISHLDLMATMRRALLRAGLALKYSEGFNPHPYMSVALPLSVGCGSACELMDIGVADGVQPGGLPGLVTVKLPEGIEVLEAYTPAAKFSGIAWIWICGAFYYDRGMPDEAAERLAERFSAETIVIQKKTKRGVSDVDIAPYIKEASFTRDGVVTMSAMVSAQNPSINPDNIISALDGEFSALKPDFAAFKRIEIFDATMKKFR